MDFLYYRSIGKCEEEFLYPGIFTIRRTLKTLRDQELCVAAHLVPEEANTESVWLEKKLKIGSNKRCEQRHRERSKGASAWKSAFKNDIVRNALNFD